MRQRVNSADLDHAGSSWEGTAKESYLGPWATPVYDNKVTDGGGLGREVAV